ncbi:MAG: polysaccharide pyruvyl transferase CsaB [Candidatus Saganbacteria bacterium]|nr:polysaccharide pyruvyl transferase CsaB [Candidatus Saganbacteria bacterium]
MKILLSGYYGFGNVGDEAVLRAIIQGLPTAQITVLSASPQLTKELNKVDSIFRYAWFKILIELIKSNLFLSGGGTLFQNSTSNKSFLYYIGLVLLAKILRKKVVILGQGFGPLKGKFYQGLAKAVLNRVDLITLRDQQSYTELKKLGVNKPPMHVVADPTGILNIPSKEEGKALLNLEGIRKGERPLLAIAVRSLIHDSDNTVFESLGKAIDWLVSEHNYLPVFLLFKCPEDMDAASKVIGIMKEDANIIFRICQPDEMLAIISQVDLLIGMRLHSLIFAAMTQTPMLGLAYDPKVEAFMQSIEEPYLKINENLNLEGLKTALENILQNKGKIKANLAEKKLKLRNMAALNFKNEYY